MARFNHSKANMQKRISYESRFHDYTPTYTRSSGGGHTYSKSQQKVYRGDRWLPMPFGKYKGMTLPQIVFDDLSYIVWIYTDDVLFAGMDRSAYSLKLAHQLEVIYNRLIRIKPPAGCEFAIVVDGAGVFERFIVLKERKRPKKPLNKGSKIVARLALLNVSVPRQCSNAKCGYERLSECLREHYFGDSMAEVSASKANAVLQDRDNFDLRGVKANKYLRARPRDISALIEKYRRSRRKRN